MTDLTIAEVAQKLLDEVAQNPPRVCIAWCGKAKDDCACYKAGVAVGALNDAAPDLARTVIALHAELAQARADAKAAVGVVIEKAAQAVWDNQPQHYTINVAAYIGRTIRAIASEDAIAEVERLRKALEEGRRAIGDHFAPNDCYATGPLTGDHYRDLVECPACSFIAMYAALAQPSTDAGVIPAPQKEEK